MIARTVGNLTHALVAVPKADTFCLNTTGRAVSRLGAVAALAHAFNFAAVEGVDIAVREISRA